MHIPSGRRLKGRCIIWRRTYSHKSAFGWIRNNGFLIEVVSTLWPLLFVAYASLSWSARKSLMEETLSKGNWSSILTMSLDTLLKTLTNVDQLQSTVARLNSSFRHNLSTVSVACSSRFYAWMSPHIPSKNPLPFKVSPLQRRGRSPSSAPPNDWRQLLLLATSASSSERAVHSMERRHSLCSTSYS